MKLKLSPKKPILDNHEPLCLFRSSKAYLWGLIRQQLNQSQQNSKKPLLILDAACHALITRAMFPAQSIYFGLDISKDRLAQALNKKFDNDTLYCADLTRKFPLYRCFDVVVSCNTLSHLPINQQSLVAFNLVTACRPKGDLLINTSIDSGMMPLTTMLLENFESVEPIYFDSFLSQDQEQRNQINSNNVAHKTIVNEQNLPNDASLHRQILLHARGCLQQGLIQDPPRSQGNKILQLNAIPQLSKCNYADDKALLSDSKIWNKNSAILMSQGLFDSKTGCQLRLKIEARGIKVMALDKNLEFTQSEIVILGMEEEWCNDLARDRLAVNRLRELPNVKITFALVEQREGKPCRPSLVAQDI